VHFGVFGLGNKQYEHFNAVGKRMHTNMEALGAAAVCRRGDGDDDDSIDDDFEKWCTELFAALDAKPELLGAAAAGGGSETLAAYRVEVLPAGALSDHAAGLVAVVRVVVCLCEAGGLVNGRR
jgi:NADPH-ferrihemoprotein reductase